MDPEDRITCVECGGTAHLFPLRPEAESPLPGDVLVYTCEDCGHRMDVVYEPADGGRPR